MKKSNRFGWCQSACGLAAIAVFGLMLSAAPKAARACAGDCNTTNMVTADDLVKAMAITLAADLVSECTAADVNMDGKVTVNEDLAAVIAALPGGCSPGRCGDGVVQAALGEDCDPGGVCIGGSNAGTACTQESNCTGNGECVDPSGLPEEIPCTDDAFCTNAPPEGAGQVAGSTCVHCVTQGTTTCAANCTTAIPAPFALVPGVVNVGVIEPNTSGANIHGDLTLPLPLSGTQTLYLGKEKNGTIPTIVTADSVSFPAIPISIGGSQLACACVRGIAAKTCGGTVFSDTGGQATDCTPGFWDAGASGDNTSDGPCPADQPCTFVHGSGNSATGVIACNAPNGLNINLHFMQDDTPASRSPNTCTMNSDCPSSAATGASLCIPDPNNPGGPNICGAFPAVLTLSGGGTGPAGSGLLLNSTAIGNVQTTTCAGFCTDNDPYSARGTISTLPLTTGTAGGTFTTADGDPTTTICGGCSDGSVDHCTLPATCAGPLTVTGQLLNCANLTATPPKLTGSCLAGAFTSANQATLGDAVITNVLCSQYPYLRSGGVCLRSAATQCNRGEPAVRLAHLHQASKIFTRKDPETMGRCCPPDGRRSEERRSQETPPLRS